MAGFSSRRQPDFVLPSMKTNASNKNDGKQSQNKAPSRTTIGKKDRDTLRERTKLVQRGPSNSAEVSSAVNQIKESGHYRNDSDTWDDYCVRFFGWPADDVERFTELYRADRWSEVTTSTASIENPPVQLCHQVPAQETSSPAEKVSAPNLTERQLETHLCRAELVQRRCLVPALGPEPQSGHLAVFRWCHTQGRAGTPPALALTILVGRFPRGSLLGSNVELERQWRCAVSLVFWAADQDFAYSVCEVKLDWQPVRVSCRVTRLPSLPRHRLAGLRRSGGRCISSQLPILLLGT
jgi:hypothetical protein